MSGGVALIAVMAAVAFRTDVRVSGPVVTLGEVADLSVLPAGLRASVRGLRLLRLPEGHGDVTWSSARAARRVAGLAPALRPWLAGTPDQPLRIRLEAPAAAPAERPCLSLRHPMSAGEPLTGADVDGVTCPVKALRSAFAYDGRSRVARARRALAPGEVVPWAAPGAEAAVRAGETLGVSTVVGPVRIERRLEALQDAPAGGRVFVRGADGVVFATRAPEARP